MLFRAPEPKAQVSLSDQNLSVARRCCYHCHPCCHKLFTFSSSSPEPLGQFQVNLAQGIFEWLFIWRAPTFPRRENYEIAKVHWQIYKNLFSRTSRPISTELGTNHLLMKRIQSYTNEGLLLFPRGDNYEIGKIHWPIWKIFLSTTTTPSSTKLATNHLWM